MRASTTRTPSEAQNRLNRARLALRLAEERTGLRDSAALTVRRALSAASTGALLSASADLPPAASPTTALAWQDSGVLTLQGSTTLLLAVLALRQGATGWCGVIGGDVVVDAGEDVRDSPLLGQVRRGQGEGGD